MHILNFNRLSKRYYLLLIIFIVLPLNIYAQCAGSDNTIDVCDKDGDANNRNFALFTQLNGVPTSGGSWSTTNPANFFALDQATGIVDLWRINNFGVHQFTYTNTNCGESATVTINLGGYPGENNIDGSANACSDDSNVNLHGFLGSEIDGKVQDFNGIWTEDPSTFTNQLDENIFNAEAAGPGIYIFYYTVAAVNTCIERTATVILEVHPSPNPGMAESITFCVNEDLSAFRNFDLNSQLTGEDANGTWSEDGTNQLSDLNDSIIDIEDLNTTFGYGSYSFTYTVYPSHPVCSEQEVTVTIELLPVFDAEMTPQNYCFGTEYSVDLTYDDSILPNGNYLITYTINGAAAATNATLNGGLGNFIVEPDMVPVNEFVTLEITAAEGVAPAQAVCPVLIVPSSTFLVSDATIDTQDICIASTSQITLNSVLDQGGIMANGVVDINYTIIKPDGDTLSDSANTSFTNGLGLLDLAAANFDIAGHYNISAEVVNSFPLNCTLETSFMVTATPSEIQLDLIVDNSCNATAIDVLVNAPTLSGGSYDITYDVVQQSNGEVLLENTISFTGGTATYDLDVASLEAGNYIVSVRSTQNDNTPCRLQFEFEESENFAVNGIPPLPVAEALQMFCLSTYPSGNPTLEDILVTATGQLFFYATESDMNILPLDTLLEDGEDYFISNTDTNNNCEGSERTQVTVAFQNPDPPVIVDANPTFCAGEYATVFDLNTYVTSTGNTVWFETSTGGTALASETILIHAKSYFAANENNNQCSSDSRVEIIATVHEISPANLIDSNLALCGLDNPTIVNLNAAEGENDFEVIWFDSEESDTPLAYDTPLTNETVYFASTYNEITGCTNSERIALIVDLTNCNPEDYGFFIPDGFSPNGDGKNDTFFIPNIEVIFPDFTLEILNRYGTRLFIGDRSRPKWDGSEGGQTAPNGVYFYVIDYHKDGFKPIQGRLYLNR